MSADVLPGGTPLVPPLPVRAVAPPAHDAHPLPPPLPVSGADPDGSGVPEPFDPGPMPPVRPAQVPDYFT